MKRLYLFFLLCFSTLLGFGQISIRSYDGIEDINHKVNDLQNLVLKSATDLNPEVAYITQGDYWGLTGNDQALNLAFGVGNWDKLYFSTVNVTDLLASDVKFIFIDGSDFGKCEFLAFLNTYRTDLEEWVASGGALFLNAAGNECPGGELAIGVSLIYGSSSTGVPTDPTHPIYNGPQAPAFSPVYYGSSWSHEYITGTDLTVLMVDYNSRPVLAEKDYGSGKFMFGGMTLEFIGQYSSWSPEPQVSNMYANIFSYMLASANLGNCINDIEQDNDPGECGAIVTYAQPTAWDTAVSVLQIDTTGFTSGDMFPVDTTVLSYRIEYPSGNVDTCTFNVIVVDTEDPVISCKDITVVLDSTGYAKISSTGAGKKVLLLWDTDNSSTQSLKTAIEAAGYEVTMPSVPEYQWDNTNPPLTDFDAVVHLDGTTWTSAMSASAQLALVDFVENQGGVFIHTEWDAFETDDNPIQTQMNDIVILQRYTGYTSNLTYTVVAGQESHPVLEGLPASFVIPEVGYSPSNLRSYSEDPSVLLMTDQYGTAAVAVREFGLGRVVGFNHAGNYTNPGALVDENVQKLFVNALNWGTNARSSLLASQSDNCEVAEISLSQDEFGYDDLGENTVEVTVTDIHGNESTCTSKVTVTIKEDITSPVAVCSNFYLYDIEAVGGSIHISPLTIDNGSYDNVGIVSYSLSQSTFTCSDIGENIVTLTVADSSGNVGTCQAVVTINDPNAPVFGAVEDISIELESGECETTVEYPEIVANDGCDVTLTLLEGLGADGSFPVGTTVEKWEAKDPAGNADTLSFSIHVSSTSVPTIDAIEDITLDVDAESVEIPLEGITDLSCLMDGLSVTASTTDETLISSLSVVYDNMSSTGTLTVVFEPGVTGTATITVTVENSQGGTAEESFDVSIMDINNVPVLTYPVEDQTINAAKVLKVLLSPVSGEYFTDGDDAVLTLSVYEEGTSSLPGWATISGDTLICTPLLPDTGCVSIVVEASDAAGATAMDTFTICVDGYVLGLNDIMEDSDISMYPNPTSGKVVLTFKNVNLGDTEIKVYTMSGQEVFRKEYRYDNEIQLDLSDQVSGIYLVRIIQGSSIETRKLILDRK